jgi:hypothetical protein
VPDALQALPLDVLHCQVVPAVVLAHVVGVDHVGVVEPGGQPRLGEEHLAELLLLGEIGPEDLDDHQLLEATERPAGRGEVDVGHSPATDLSDEAIATGEIRSEGFRLHLSHRHMLRVLLHGNRTAKPAPARCVAGHIRDPPPESLWRPVRSGARVVHERRPAGG